MRFEPDWREKGDCGRTSLYVLLRLADKQVPMEVLKKSLPIDPDTGCSLAEVAHAAEKVGLQVEIQFVKPRDVPKVNFPCILHQTASLEKRTGHFAVVAAYNPNRHEYSIVDTDWDRLVEQPEEALLKNFSGYVMVPKDGSVVWSRLAAYSLIGIGSGLAVIALFRPKLLRSRRTVT
jgi:ABC-type bacteriocin/lantibiotic exporter with double-glycine peptidase domain